MMVPPVTFASAAFRTLAATSALNACSRLPLAPTWRPLGGCPCAGGLAFDDPEPLAPELSLLAAPAIAEPPRARAPRAARAVPILRTLWNILSPHSGVDVRAQWAGVLGVPCAGPGKALRGAERT